MIAELAISVLASVKAARHVLQGRTLSRDGDTMSSKKKRWRGIVAETTYSCMFEQTWRCE